MIYLPMIMKNYKRKPFLSTWVERVNDESVSYVHPKARVHTGIKWMDSEDFGDLAERRALLSHVDRSIQIKNSPEWARVYPQYECSPVKGDYWRIFAQFVVDVVMIYQPYAVELWNEPEVRRDELWAGADKYIGCFGEDDMYNGGAGFGRFVGYVYDYVKKRCKVEIWGGALMLGNEGHWSFTEGFVSTAKMDKLSYHSYSGYVKNFTHAINKATRLRGFYDGPIVLSETAYQWDGMDDLQADYQAEYLEYTYNRLDEVGVDGMNWYTLMNNGWKNTDLIYRDHIRPAYHTYRRICDEI